MSLLRRTTQLGACTLLAAITTALHAQAVVSGTVTDSLTQRPFAGATVQLVPANAPWSAGYAARSDSLGRFRIDSVAAGTYTFGFTHPRLDSLGVDAVTRTISVAPGATSLNANLALPSAGTLAFSLCGTRSDTTGVAIGRVLDAATGAGRANARVRAHWGELVLVGATMRPTTSQVVTRTSDDGRFTLCGVPTDVAVFLQALDADTSAAPTAVTRDSSGSIEVQFATGVPLLHRDLYLTSSAAATVAADARDSGCTRTTRVTGRVLSPEGQFVPAARVRIGEGLTAARYAITDSTGAFILSGVPAGTQSLQVIAIGFAPARMAVDLRPGVTANVTVQMQVSVATLDAVKVVGILSRDAAEYAARAKRGGQGFFMSGDAVRDRGQPFVSYALLRAPGLKLADTKFGRPVIAGSFSCQPRFFLDGWEIPSDELDRLVSVDRLGGIEVYRQPAEVPPQLMRSLLASPEGRDPCSMVFVWSRAVVP